MDVALDQWLTEHREDLLPRWVAAFDVAAPTTNGDSTTAADETGANNPFAALSREDINTTLAHLYEGLVLAARGDDHLLDNHLHTMPQVNGQRINLPHLFAMAFHFRRLAWEVFEDNLTDTDGTFALMNDLERLLEHTIQSIAHAWETATEAEIQERISQAEFIAESMASAIEQADRTALQLSSLNTASQQLTTSLENVSELVNRMGTTLLNLMGVASISIWLPERMETNPAARLDMEQRSADTASHHEVTLVAEQAWGIDDDSVVGMQVSGTASDNPLLKAYFQMEVVLHHSPSPNTTGPWYHKGHGILVLPLLVKDHTIGVVLLQDPDSEERFSRSQQDLARALVNQAAIALENARLYAKIRSFNAELEELVEERTHELQAEKERLATIHEISTEISSTLDLDMLLHTSLEALARITHVEYGSIMLMEGDTGHLVNRAVLGQKQVNTYARFPIGQGVAGWVAQHREPALIHDVAQDERWMPLTSNNSTDDEATQSKKNRGSMLAVPLIAQGEVSGVLILSHSEPGYFNDGHLRLLTASAGAIAIGINNANMYTTIFEQMEHSSELLQHQQTEASKMEAILQSLSDGVLVCDTYGAIISANPTAARILQCDLEEFFMGTSLFDVLDRLLDKRSHDMPLEDLMAHPFVSQDIPRAFESTVEVNMRVISLTLGPVLKDNSELIGALLLMRDSTREVEADRLKTEFIGTMSHELRTPMTSIKGFTQLLVMGGLGPINDNQREFLQTIQNNAERMISMINDVLDITKIETGSIDLELGSIHMAEAISGVVSELDTLIRKREHTLSMQINPSLPQVRADVARLHQILLNLVSNAIKYTPQGGHIWIEAHEVKGDNLPDDVRRVLRKDRRYVQMNIRDTGVGIAENELDRIFERFYRTENELKIEAGGTGLGLSLVKPLVELLGGRIWVESVLNEGSTFRFVLPVA